jgi:hypothetical protein
MFSSPSIIRMVKSRRMRWACSTNGEERKWRSADHIDYWWEIQKERDHC